MELTEIDRLIAQIVLGDRVAFSSLYDATSGKLFAVCLRVLKQRAAAEDALQDTYVKIWKNAGRYQVTGHSPMTWLIMIARNTAIDRLREGKPTQDIDDYSTQLFASGPTPEQSAIASADAKQILRCFDELDADHSNAIKGAYLDGNSYKDLAVRFDVPLNTMRTWLRRGLTALRECMSR
jgi:RNA polymerase sigma-70 factor (ECF subfamily)